MEVIVKEFVCYEKDWWQLVLHKAEGYQLCILNPVGAKAVEMVPLFHDVVRVSWKLEREGERAELDLLMRQRMFDITRMVMHKYENRFVEQVFRLDLKIAADLKDNTPSGIGSYVQQFEQDYKKLKETIQTEAVAEAERKIHYLFEQMKFASRQYAAYKAKAMIDMGVKATGLAGSALAATTSCGIGLGIGFAAIVKITADIVNDLRLLNKDADSLDKEIWKELNKLERQYHEESRTSVGAQEVAAAVVKHAVVFSPTSISHLQERNTMLRNKVYGMQSKAQVAAMALKECLTEIQNIVIDQLGSQDTSIRSSADVVLPTHRRTFRRKKSWSKLADALLDKVTSLADSIDCCNGGQIDNKRRIDTLLTQKPDWSKRAEKFAAVYMDITNLTGGIVDIAINSGVTLALEASDRSAEAMGI
jgi:hypothetical protein